MSKNYSAPRTRSSSVYNKYPKDHTFEGRQVLNAGCGFAKFSAPNVINVDASDTARPNVTWNLGRTPLPFKDEQFDLIIANHILEHVPDWWDCFKEFSRILKTGGRIEVWLPGNGNDSQVGYRDHINTINHCSFYGTFETNRHPGNAWAADNIDDFTRRLKIVDQLARLEDYWWLRFLTPKMRGWAAIHLRNVVYEIGFFFEKQPAPVIPTDSKAKAKPWAKVEAV